MATILRRNLISVTERPVTLVDASYHSQHPDRVILYFSKTTDIDQVHINPPWRVVDRISVDGAWTLHLEYGEDAPVSLVLFGAHHQLKPAHTELDIIAGKNAFLAQHPNFVPLKAIGLGHKSAMVLRRMEQLIPVMLGAIKGTLTQSEFYQRNRDRKNTLVYRRNIEEYLTARGKEHRIGRFRRTFKQRRAAHKAYDFVKSTSFHF